MQHLPPEIRDRTALRVVEAYGEAHIRYGKADTGRLLDGDLWDEFPM